MKQSKLLTAAIAFSLLSVALIGCAGQNPAPTPAPAPAPNPAPGPAPTLPPALAPKAAAFLEITVTAKLATFEPSTITVAKGETVKLTLISTDAPHTFTIDELGVNVSVGAGQTVTKEFTVEKAGTFAFYCAVGQHRAAGMEGTLKATE